MDAASTLASPSPSTSFEDNFRLLEKLATDLEGESVSIDQLIPRAKEGAEAAGRCFDVLRRSEEALVEIDRVYAEIAGDARGVPPKPTANVGASS